MHDRQQVAQGNKTSTTMGNCKGTARTILKGRDLLWMITLSFVAWKRHGQSFRSASAFGPWRSSAFLGHRVSLRSEVVALRIGAASRSKSMAAKSVTSTPNRRLVIVESPAKCETIARILNEKNPDDSTVYEVVSCKGHVRNLSSKKPDTPLPLQFPYSIPGVDLAKAYSPLYEVLPEKVGVVRELKKAAARAGEILLATDADREGEAMAWHLTQVLGDKLRYKRVSFVELTPTAILEAITNPCDLNPHLIAAQETRRVLDRLAGYTVSPVLWKKISPGLSAGRVQSVAMALLVQRERERLLFPATQYWKVTAEFDDNEVPSPLSEVSFTMHSLNETLVVATKSADFKVQAINPSEAVAVTDKYHLDTEDRALELVSQLNDPKTSWTVRNVTSHRRTQTPPLPFITSSLQQEAFHGLGWDVSQTMRVAQQLYEKGLITYMRTDSTNLSQDADDILKRTLCNKYYVPSKASNLNRKKRRKATKFSQEAHEAIRPAILNGGFVPPTNVQLDEQSTKLYRMIFQRTLASSMAPRVINSTRVVVQGVNRFGSAEFVATGNVEIEPGYVEAYAMGVTAPSLNASRIDEDDYRSGSKMEDFRFFPSLEEGQVLHLRNLLTSRHATQPPARYTEASFVKLLESLGVGRPSTYAKIIQVLKDRGYVFGGGSSARRSRPASGGMIPAQRASGQAVDVARADNARGGSLVPTLSAFAVASLLENHCSSLVDPSFTASMEDHLDLIASGGKHPNTLDNDDDPNSAVDRIHYLNKFYAGPSGLAARIKRIEDDVKSEEARQVTLPSLYQSANSTDLVALRVGPWGPYIQMLAGEQEITSSEKAPTAPLPFEMSANLSLISPESLRGVLSARSEGGFLLGQHPDDGRNIRLKTGRFGAYLQWGDDGDEFTTSHSLPKGITSGVNGTLSWEDAVGYVSLPRTVCYLDNLPILASLGPYGPYLKYNNSYVSLTTDDGDVLSVDSETAERRVTERIKNRRSQKALGVVAELGVMEGNMVRVKSGRFGKYINWKKVNAKIPTQYSDVSQSLSLDEAWTLLQQRITGTKGSNSLDSHSRSRPKRPKSSYQYFCEEMRPQLAPNITSLGQSSKALSRLWAETIDRSRYDNLSAADRQRYEQEKAVALQAKSSRGPQPRTDRISKDFPTPGARRSPSAYILFCRENRPSLLTRDGEKPSFAEASKLLATMWKECEDSVRLRFQQQAEEEKHRWSSDQSI
jgi:DNA topoisomerase-1